MVDFSNSQEDYISTYSGSDRIDKAYHDLCGDTFNLDAFNFIKTGAEGKATTVDEELKYDINISNGKGR